MSHLFLLTAVLLVLPTAAMYMKQAPQTAPQYIPKAYMAFEKAYIANHTTRHFLGENCADPAQKQAFDDPYTPPVNLTGDWVLKEIAGDVDMIFLLSGVSEAGLKILKEHDYGAGHMVDHINHTGKTFSILHKLKELPNTETLTYEIGGPEIHNTNNSHDDIQCVHWTNRTKNTLVFETIDFKTGHKMPTLARYLWNDNLFVTVHSHYNGTKYECVEHWERVDNKVMEEPKPDNSFAGIIGLFPVLINLY